MGKETKIGLAVIAVLLVVFSVLLFRHLTIGESVGQWDNKTRAAAEPLSRDNTSQRPNVVSTQKGEPDIGVGDRLWDPSPEQASSPSAVEVPAGSYMPAEREPGGGSDRYTIGRQNFEAEQEPLGTNPFQHQESNDAVADDGEPGANGPLEVPEESPSDGASSQETRPNPLRRIGAELPLNDDRTTEGDLPDDVDRRDAVDEQPAQSVEAPHDLDPPRGPTSTTGEGTPGPTVADEPQDALRDPFDGDELSQPAESRQEPFADDARREAFADDSRSDPSRDNDRHAPADSDWMTTDATHEPAPIARGPLPVENGMYNVQPNDTLWSISEKVYGTGGYFKALAAHNQATLPRRDQLSVGMKVAVPPVEELERNYPSLCPKQRKSALVQPRAIPATATVPRTAGGDVYVVQEGDTLFDIARHELGTASRWAEIYEMNRSVLGEDFDYLQPGTELRLPPKTRKAETLSGGGQSSYLR